MERYWVFCMAQYTADRNRKHFEKEGCQLRFLRKKGCWDIYHFLSILHMKKTLSSKKRDSNFLHTLCICHCRNNLLVSSFIDLVSERFYDEPAHKVSLYRDKTILMQHNYYTVTEKDRKSYKLSKNTKCFNYTNLFWCKNPISKNGNVRK